MSKPHYRAKSLEGTKVEVHSLDGVALDHSLPAVLVEIAPFGLLFRSRTDRMIFASSASFTSVEDDD